MHVLVVGNVVAPVLVRGGHGRRQPDAVHAEPGQVVQPRDDAVQVAVAITVGVQPRPDVKLVQDGAVPPAPPDGVLIHVPPRPRSRPERDRAAPGLMAMPHQAGIILVSGEPGPLRPTPEMAPRRAATVRQPLATP